jgi:hypothetical protein
MEPLVQQNMNKIYINVISALFWVITQQVVAISYGCFEPTCQSHPQVSRENFNPEDWIDRLSRNVDKKLQILAA